MNLGDLIRAFRARLVRRWRVMVGFVLAAIVLALLYVQGATPLYTANGAVLIDPRLGASPGDSSQTMMPGLLLSDALTVDSQVSLLTSRELTTRVVKALKLHEKTEDSSPSLRQRLFGWVPLGSGNADEEVLSPEAEQQRRIEAVRTKFAEHLTIERRGDSYAIDIAYVSPSRGFSSEVVNTLMREYLRLAGERQRTNAENNRDWLSGRIEDLGREVELAETAVAQFREANGLLAPDGASLPSEIALNEAIREMVSLRAGAVDLKVQSDRLASQIASGEIDAVEVPPEGRSAALTKFEDRYAELRQTEQDQVLVWDEGAPALTQIREQIAKTRALILGELRVSLDRIDAQIETKNTQIMAVDRLIGELRKDYAADATKLVQMRGLSRLADAKRALYEKLLEEFNSTSQLMTFESSSAQVIAWAVPPDNKSAPKSKQIVVLAVLGAAILAVGAILLLDVIDSSFRSPSDLSRELGLTALGVLPTFRSDHAADTSQEVVVMRSKTWRKLSRTAQRFDFAAVHPHTASAEAVRGLHVRLALQRERQGGGGLVTGIVSSMRGEGKTTTTANLAAYMARKGESVVLVDLDLLSRDLSRQLGPVLPEPNALSKLIADPKATLDALVEVEEFPGLAIIGNPVSDQPQITVPRDTAALQEALQYLRTQFDHVLVDLPPILGAADTQILARFCDQLVFVIRWGTTPREQVISALQKGGLSRQRFLGALFTQADLQSYCRYNFTEVTDYDYGKV